MAYSLAWANQIISRVWEKHRDSCDLMQKYYAFSPGKLADYLTRNDIRWRQYKKLIKYDEAQRKLTEDLYYGNKGLQKNYLTFDQYYKVHLGRINYKLFWRQLDMFSEEYILREQ